MNIRKLAESGSLVSIAETLPGSLAMSKLVISRQHKQAQYYTEPLGEGIGLEMISIPGGKFLMGSPKDELKRGINEGPQHLVTVPPFFMGRYPITQKQWSLVARGEGVNQDLDSDPSYFKEPYQDIDRWKRPVERVSWNDAKEFCDRLSKKTTREYRLPTEAEWEYACRAGINTPFHFGKIITTDYANYNGKEIYGDSLSGEYRAQTTPVGYFKVANGFGLYDMHGNVWEWCEDYYHRSYDQAPTDGSAWLKESKNTTKVLRGGSWFDFPWDCRCAFRDTVNPAVRLDVIGLRVVRVAPRTLL